MPLKFIENYFRWYYASISLGLALIFASQYFAFRNIEDLSAKDERLHVTIAILNQTANLGLLTKDLQSNTRGYLITQDTGLLLETHKKKVELGRIRDTLFLLVKDDSLQTKKVQELYAISDSIVGVSHRDLGIFRLEGQRRAFAEIQGGAGIRLNRKLTAKINEVNLYQRRNLENHREFVAQTQRKSLFFILITGIVGFFLTALAIILLNRDKRERQQLQIEINKKEKLLNQYLEAIPDGVMVVNKEKEIVLLNQSGREILGIRPGKLTTVAEELADVKLMDPTRYLVRFNPDALPVTRGLEGEKLIGNKIDLIRNNKIYHLETNVQPVIGLDGEVLSAITVFRDITERAKYEATLERARTLAEKSVHVKDIFLSNVSHEIRTPLNAIIGFTSLLTEEVREPKSAEYVGYIQVASKNLLELINDILDFSKIEAGQVYLEKAPASISDLVHSMSVIVNQRATEKGIEYACIMSEDLPTFVETDKLRLTQILLNVCGNAVKFTEKGSVKLYVEPVSEMIGDMQNIRFQVKDTGIGIAKDKISDVFQRFVQATESTTRIFGGTGLGLSIVKSLVQLFDGKLDVQSEVGRGTIFTMDFPMRVLENVQVEPEVKIDERINSSISAMKVLAAEDNLLNQKLLSAIFERLKTPLTIVNNGLEAIEQLQKGDFDLVLMDIQMPVMDGYTAIQKIRGTISKTIPIITMTAHAMVGEKEECLAIGANSYISKPFKESELFAAIALLGKKDNSEFPIPVVQQPQKKQNDMPDSLLNLEYLSEITGGDAELRAELIVMFENDSLTQLSLMDEFSGSGELEKLRMSIHKFRSSLFSVGLLSTANQYKVLEAELKQGIWNSEMAAMLPELRNEAELGLMELRKL
jgi:PAS domain S-box-containing protein